MLYNIPFLLESYKLSNFSMTNFCALIKHEKYAAFYKCTEECFRPIPTNKGSNYVYGKQMF